MKKAKPAILVTGGSGAIGSALVDYLIKTMGDEFTIRVFDNDEYSIWKLQQKLRNEPNIRYLLGDVRDFPRLKEAMHGVQYVFHCAALKHVALCEFNPFDAVETNIIGTQNTIRAALEEKTVDKFIYISTDKAVNPTSLMGATKLIGERLVLSANYIKGSRSIKLSVARFANVRETRGNVFEAWQKQLECDGQIIVNSDEMTRYFISIKRAIEFLVESFKVMKGGEIFIPLLKESDTYKIIDVARSWLSEKGVEAKIVKGKPWYGEKMYEELYTKSEEQFLVKISPTLQAIKLPKFDFIEWKLAEK